MRIAFNISSINSCVLDVGCGVGSYLIALSKNGRKCYGIDPLREISLKPALVRTHEENLNVAFCLSVAEFLPFKSNIFDIVLCISTLQHVANQHITIREIKRVLKNDGLALISVPISNVIKKIFSHRNVPHYYTMEFNVKRLRELLANHGFQILYIDGLGFLMPLMNRALYIVYHLLGEKTVQKIIEFFNIFARIWLSTASSLIVLCKKAED